MPLQTAGENYAEKDCGEKDCVGKDCLYGCFGYWDSLLFYNLSSSGSHPIDR